MIKINRFVKIGVPILFLGAVAVSVTVYADRKHERRSHRSRIQEPSYKGSLIVGNAKEADFPGMAKISFQDAMQSAVVKVPGEVLKAELENENGYLVYGVEIVSLDKSITEVKIDAGSGIVLALKKDEEDHHEGRKSRH
jgi:uncharacterized membrane protein YkoI